MEVTQSISIKAMRANAILLFPLLVSRMCKKSYALRFILYQKILYDYGRRDGKKPHLRDCLSVAVASLSRLAPKEAVKARAFPLPTWMHPCFLNIVHN
ncbi:Uncharacterised protein [uncultured archaeon]|nr:Uncharacterised protein [uncultured archaeon]